MTNEAFSRNLVLRVQKKEVVGSGRNATEIYTSFCETIEKCAFMI
jgi:hypothetical protein